MKNLTTYIEKLSAKGKLLIFAAAAVVSIAAMASAGGATHADYIPQLCALSGRACLNNWNGDGTYVNVETPGFTNNSFTVVPSATSGMVNIKYNNSIFNECVGDSNNNSSIARAGIVNGCGQSDIGWGGNFYQISCFNALGVSGESFKNVHWSNGVNAWLGPNGTAAGSPFYLNKPTSYCFTGPL